MNFDPDIYTITIRKEEIDGEVYYVGRVAEFANITAYEESHDAALEIIRNSLREIAARAQGSGRQLPAPISESCAEPSGRLTLRMPRSLHAKLNAQAQIDDASANQLVNLAIAEYLTGASVAELATNKITGAFDEGMAKMRSLHGNIHQALFSSAQRSFQQQNTYYPQTMWPTTPVEPKSVYSRRSQ